MSVLVTCAPDQVVCDNGWQCIFRNKLCNGVVECDGGGDERYCATYRPPCGENYFRCNDGSCIPNWRKCDGYADCGRGEDEYDCNQGTVNTPASGPNVVAILLPVLLGVWLIIIIPVVIYAIKRRHGDRQRRAEQAENCQDSTLALPGLFPMPAQSNGRARISTTQMNVSMMTTTIDWPDGPPGYETDCDPPKYADAHLDCLALSGDEFNTSMSKGIPGKRIWDTPPPSYKISTPLTHNIHISVTSSNQGSMTSIGSAVNEEMRKNERRQRRRRSYRRDIPPHVMALARNQVNLDSSSPAVDSDTASDDPDRMRNRHVQRTDRNTNAAVMGPNDHGGIASDNTAGLMSNQTNASSANGSIGDNARNISSQHVGHARQRTLSESACYDNAAFVSDIVPCPSVTASSGRGQSHGAIHLLSHAATAAGQQPINDRDHGNQRNVAHALASAKLQRAISEQRLNQVEPATRDEHLSRTRSMQNLSSGSLSLASTDLQI